MKRSLKLFLVLLLSVFMIGNKEVLALTSKNYPEFITTYEELVGDGDTINGNSSNYSVRRIGANKTGETIGQGYQLFSLEKNKSIPLGIKYKKTKEITDKGLLYLMETVENNTGALHRKLGTWIEQVAIYDYQKKIGAANSDGFTDTMLTSIKEDTYVTTSASYETEEYPDSENRTAKLYETYVEAAVNNAVKLHRGEIKDLTYEKPDLALDSTETKLSEDGKYYTTGYLQVKYLRGSTNYSLTLTNAPEGTKVYTDTNEEITTLNSIPSEKSKVYLKIPADKVTEKTKNITVTARVLTFTGYEFTAIDDAGNVLNDYQKLGNYDYEYQDKSLSIAIAHTTEVPNTAQAISKIIYLIAAALIIGGSLIVFDVVKLNKKTQNN